jgi:endonuclease/exonuclease/phosphatase family metal-dependent hydrolase
MKLITWNIQWCRGVDGRVDPRRIIEHARRLGDFDVLCLQEVASNFGMLGGSDGEDQFALLAALAPEHTPVAGVAVDIPDGRGGRRLFGNMVLSRYPVERVIRHALPYPPEPGFKTMPRMLIEAVVEAPFGPVRVMTTHCEFNSQRQRNAQVEAMRAIQHEAASFAREDDKHVGDAGTFKWMARPSAAILTADFNMRADNPALSRLVEPFENDTPAFRDAWRALHGEAPQPHTVGVYDREQWPEAHACDFVFITENLAPRLKNIIVDQESAASDHQPILVELAD